MKTSWRRDFRLHPDLLMPHRPPPAPSAGLSPSDTDWGKHPAIPFSVRKIMQGINGNIINFFNRILEEIKISFCGVLKALRALALGLPQCPKRHTSTSVISLSDSSLTHRRKVMIQRGFIFATTFPIFAVPVKENIFKGQTNIHLYLFA